MRKIERAKIAWVILGLVSLSLAVWLKFAAPSVTPPPATTVVPSPEPQLEYQSYTLPNSVIHTLTIPSQSIATVTVATGVDSLENLARESGAIAAINGGFFDPNNQKSTSYVLRNGRVVADPRQNERLTNNPQLTPYLAQIFNRTEWRRYQCDREVRYAIALRQDPSPEGCQIVDALGGGPRLLPELTAEQEAFVTRNSGRPMRDPLGSTRPNARSALGIMGDGRLLFAIAAQKPENPTNSGLSLSELATFLQDLGVEAAMNLDGGSSSALYYQGTMFYGKVDEAGNWVKRPVKSVLSISSPSI
jgi:Phosphodiester glycosidase